MKKILNLILLITVCALSANLELSAKKAKGKPAAKSKKPGKGKMAPAKQMKLVSPASARSAGPVPTAGGALQKAKNWAEKAGEEALEIFGELGNDLKEVLEDILGKHSEIASHAGNSTAGERHMLSLKEATTHPGHSGDSGVKQARTSLDSASSQYASVKSSAKEASDKLLSGARGMLSDARSCKKR